MSDERAVLGGYAEWRMIKTRKVLQIIVEFPLEASAEVFAKLGYAMPDKEIPVCIARIDPAAATASRQTIAKAELRRALVATQEADLKAERADDMRKALVRAVLYTKDQRFIGWAHKRKPEVADEASARKFIHDECDIASRSEIATDDGAYEAFLRLETSYLVETNSNSMPARNH